VLLETVPVTRPAGDPEVHSRHDSSGWHP
jgi:hypothetical protein